MSNVFRKYFNTETDFIKWRDIYGHKKSIELVDFIKGGVDGKKYYYVNGNGNKTVWEQFLTDNNLHTAEPLDLSHFYYTDAGALLSSKFVNSTVYLGKGAWFYASVNNMPWKYIEITCLFGQTVSCNQMPKLETLIVHNCDNSSTVSTNSFLIQCPKLKKVILKNYAMNNIHLDDSTLLTREAVIELFESLGVNTKSYTITLPNNVKALLKAEDIKIATDKGWTLA